MASPSLSDCLLAALSPDPSIRKSAEQAIAQAQKQPDFGALSLAIVQDASAAGPTRQGAALAFKNYVKREWVPEEDAPDVIPEAARTQLKSQLVAVLVGLSSTPQLQVQIQESVSIIAEADFADRWPELIDQLVGRLDPNDWAVNNSLLGTAHSIFRKWRAQFRTDELFLQIKFVLERFCAPYLGLWKHVDSLLATPDSLSVPQLKLLARTLLLLVQLYYDLNSQDFPEFFEDHLDDFMTLLLKYLSWSHPALSPPPSAEEDDDGADDGGDLEKVRAGICEICELYSQRYLDAFPMMGSFVETVWGLLTKLGPQQRYDILVSKATRFLSVVVKMPSQRTLFENPGTLEAFCEKIVLPNMSLRNFEVEMFEDDPAEYVRRDLEGSDAETRRQAASDFTRALMEQFEKEVTGIMTKYVHAYLQQYSSNPQSNWKSKDAAVSLLASVASRSSTSTGGVTSTNSLVDVVRFFSEHVASDLSAAPGSVHPIIVADAIKFLHTFRNQLTKDQLLAVIPMLSPHLAHSGDSVVVQTYAAATIERILFLRPDGKLLFTQADIKPHTDQLLVELFKLIRRGNTPQSIASNDILMKCVMRILLTARTSIGPAYESVLSNLVFIVGEIAKNPSNPKFNHYTFESISAIVRFVAAGNPAALAKVESVLFPPFTAILTADIQEFSPFVFQILSQLLEIRSMQASTAGLPPNYAQLLPPLLMPVVWEPRGNVPALVRLLRAFLAADAAGIVQQNRVPSMLGVFQKLIGSKVNDGHGFDLLQTMFEYLPIPVLQPYLRNVFMLVLTRLHQSKTDKFVHGFLYLLMFVFALERPDLSPDTVINEIDQIQTGIFAQVFESVLLAAVPSTAIRRRRVVALGHVSLLTRSSSLQSGPYATLYLPTLKSLLKLFNLSLVVLKPTGAEAADDADVEAADLESPGYQTGFSKLGASEGLQPKDPLAALGDPREALAKGLVAVGEAQPGKIPGLLNQVPADDSRAFTQWLSSTGIQLR